MGRKRALSLGSLGLLFLFPFASAGNSSDELFEAEKQKAALVSSLYPRAELQSACGTHLYLSTSQAH